MLKLSRCPLPPALPATTATRGPKAKSPQKDLDDRQEDIDRAYDPTAKDVGQLVEKHWGRFKSRDGARAKKGAPSVKGALLSMTHGKCAYCESRGANQIEHHWPKAPAVENGHRGTPARMFQWQNLLPACSTCNAPDRKGARMEWIGVGTELRPKLLDPSAPGDDPSCYFEIQRSTRPEFAIGWMDPRPDLSPEAASRARYTIETLQLNDLDYALGGRQATLHSLDLLLRHTLASGPDEVLESGTTLREVWASFLSAKHPYLAPVRRIFQEDPELRNDLVSKMPELVTVIAEWDLTQDDCKKARGALDESAG